MNKKLMKLGLAALGAGCLFTGAGCDADAPHSADESLEGESGMQEEPPQDPDEESGSECSGESTPSTLADKDTIVDLSIEVEPVVGGEEFNIDFATLDGRSGAIRWVNTMEAFVEFYDEGVVVARVDQDLGSVAAGGATCGGPGPQVTIDDEAMARSIETGVAPVYAEVLGQAMAIDDRIGITPGPQADVTCSELCAGGGSVVGAAAGAAVGAASCGPAAVPCAAAGAGLGAAVGVVLGFMCDEAFCED